MSEEAVEVRAVKLNDRVEKHVRLLVNRWRGCLDLRGLPIANCKGSERSGKGVSTGAKLRISDIRRPALDPGSVIVGQAFLIGLLRGVNREGC